MATGTKKKEGFFKPRKGGGMPEMTNKGLILAFSLIAIFGGAFVYFQFMA